MKKITLLMCFLVFVGIGKSQPKSAKNQPNILIFLVDDMGWQDTSVAMWNKPVPNNTKYHTPSMERLASQGVTFTQGYAASVCSPSRVSLITGANPARHRVTNWTLNRNTATDVEDSVLAPPAWNVNGVSTTPDLPNAFHAKPLPQLLKEAGYYTICIGKAHFGAKDTPAENPLNLGFEINIGGHAGGGLASYSGLTNFGNRTDGQLQSQFAIPDLETYWGRDISVTEALTQETIKVLENRPKEKPFFLYLSHYAVHTPIEADPRFIQKYLDRGLDPIEARYASMVEAMDKSLGDVLDYLKDRNLLENTFILFLSDNGGLSALARGGQLHQHNFPLNSGKGSAYEGGVRVPFIASWKGNANENTRNESPVIIEDVFPTLLEIANATPKNIPQVIDGQSFTKAIYGKKINKNRPLFWHFPNNWYTVEGHGLGASSSVRLGDWKLIYMHKTAQIELFNLRKDIGETSNLAQKYPKKVRKLARLLTEYLQKVQAQMPTNKHNGKPIPYPSEVAGK